MNRKKESDLKEFGVIGFPINHSLSAPMHNAAFRELKISAIYKPYEVKASDLKPFVEKLKNKEIHGFNVTIPHKESIIPYLDELTPRAKKIGAVNTVVITNGKTLGDNTDGDGYLKSLTEDTGVSLKGINVVIFGAGGASKAICFALCDTGIESLTIINRNHEKARQLATNLEKHYPTVKIKNFSFDELESSPIKEVQLIINTTSLGMSNNPWPSLDFLSEVCDVAIISDIVYNPKETALINASLKRGLKVHYGLGMLVEQGALAFKLFTGVNAPSNIMRATLEKELL